MSGAYAFGYLWGLGSGILVGIIWRHFSIKDGDSLFGERKQ